MPLIHHKVERHDPVFMSVVKFFPRRYHIEIVHI